MIYKISPDEKRTVRRAAMKTFHTAFYTALPNIRYSTVNGDTHLNVLMISDDPKWNDTDLHDRSSWTDFCRKGVELKNGRALVDVASEERLDGGDLLGHLQLFIENGALVRIEADGVIV